MGPIGASLHSGAVMNHPDNRPALQFEITVRTAGDSGVTVVAAVAYKTDAKAIARSIAQRYSACTVTIREVKS